MWGGFLKVKDALEMVKARVEVFIGYFRKSHCRVLWPQLFKK
jgi:hypothetical protein